MSRYNAAIDKLLARMPPRMKALPATDDGWPQLWFAGITREGKPDLRSADPAKWVKAVTKDLCWLCGQTIGVRKTFVIGPMCAITRTTSEPPCHRDCAEFAAVACPFLSRPKMRRNDAEYPEGHTPAPGIPIQRNPGVACLWVTKGYTKFRTGAVGASGWLIRIGDPVDVLWYAEGRVAARDQVMASIDSGYPLLEAEARREMRPIAALAELSAMRTAAERWLPHL